MVEKPGVEKSRVEMSWYLQTFQTQVLTPEQLQLYVCCFEKSEVEQFMVKKSWVEKFRIKKSGIEKSGIWMVPIWMVPDYIYGLKSPG